MRAPQTIVFSVFHISRCSPPSVRKNKRGDIWVAVGCEVEHQTPPRAPGVSRGEGRHDVSAGITSSFFFLPAPSEAKVSGQISLYNRQDEKQQPPSDAVRSASDTMGAIHAWCFHQWSCHFKIPRVHREVKRNPAPPGWGWDEVWLSGEGWTESQTGIHDMPGGVISREPREWESGWGHVSTRLHCPSCERKGVTHRHRLRRDTGLVFEPKLK